VAKSSGSFSDVPATVQQADPLVFVTVGTDHHPFDRLIRWVDTWLEGAAGNRTRCLIQHGTSAPPTRAQRSDYLTYDAMFAAIEAAEVVVCHGGPGTIMLTAYAGKVPIVVPRLRALGEHVDDHQLVFARRVARDGTIALAEDEGCFRALLERALVAPLPRRTIAAPPATEAVRRFEAIVDELVFGKKDRVGAPAP
jgi:UDP-N-acetylglucosamine transferase subunit ALG13